MHRLVLRALVVVLIGSAVLVLGASQVLAGCHYGDGRSFDQKKNLENPREHARNFSFLGQWVYERGDMKYVPWQGAAPCHGPHCQADEPLPASTLTPTSTVTRILSIILLPVKANPIHCDASAGWLCHEDCAPLPGFAFEHEHPPRAAARF